MLREEQGRALPVIRGEQAIISAWPWCVLPYGHRRIGDLPRAPPAHRSASGAPRRCPAARNGPANRSTSQLNLLTSPLRLHPALERLAVAVVRRRKCIRPGHASVQTLVHEVSFGQGDIAAERHRFSPSCMMPRSPSALRSASAVAPAHSQPAAEVQRET